MLAAHLDLENPTHRFLVKRFWDAPALPEKPGLKAVDLFRACDRRPRSTCSGSSPPTRSSRCPRPTRWRRRIAQRPARRRLRHVRDDRHRPPRPRPAPRPRLGREVRAPSPTPSAASPASARSSPLRARRSPTGGRSPKSAAASATPQAFAYEISGRDLPRARRAFGARRRRGPRLRHRRSRRRRLRRHAARAMAGRRRRPASSPTAASSPPTASGRMIAVTQAAAAEARAALPAHPQHRPRPRPVAHDDPHRPLPASRPAHRRALRRDPPGRRRGPRHRPRRPRRGDEPPRPRPRPRPRHRPRADRAAIFVPMHWSGEFASQARVDALVPAATDPHSGQPALQGRPRRGTPPRRRLVRLRRLPPPPGPGHRLLGDRGHALRLARRARRRRPPRRLARARPRPLRRARRPRPSSSRTAPAAPPASP